MRQPIGAVRVMALAGLLGVAIAPLVAAHTAEAATGASWIPLEASQPSQTLQQDIASTASVTSLSCPAPGTCFGAGGFVSSTGELFQGDVVSLSDGAWTSEPQVLPPTAPNLVSTLTSISCSSTTSCTAVGVESDRSQQNESGYGPSNGLIAVLSNGSWTENEAPNPASPLPGGGAGSLTDVECPGPNDCVALGNYFYDLIQGNGVTTEFEPFIDTEVNGAWTVTSIPITLGAGDYVASSFWKGLGCLSVGTCIALDNFEVCSSDGASCSTQGVTLTSAAGVWTMTVAPTPANAAGPATLAGLSCVAGSCTIVGGYEDSGGQLEGLIDVDDGGVWSTSEAPLTPGATYGGLRLVSCAAANSCVAIGYDNDGTQDPLIETESAGSWSAADGPFPVGIDPSPRLSGLSCDGAGDCVAVGTGQLQGSQLFASLIYTLTGGTWTAQVAPLPGNALTSSPSNYDYFPPADHLDSVDCPTLGTCVLLGTYSVAFASCTGQCSQNYTNESFFEDAAAGPEPSSASSTLLSRSVQSETFGEPLTLTATVSNSGGTGTVEFTTGSVPIEGCASQPVVASQGAYVATCTTTALSGGDHWLAALYEDDATSLSSSDAITQTVLALGQSISFTSSAPSNASFGGAPYDVAAIGGGSGLPIAFSSSTPTTCSVSGSSVTFIGVGPCTIDADQSGDADYLVAPTVTQTFPVGPAPTNDDASFPRVLVYGDEGAMQFASTIGVPSGLQATGSVQVDAGHIELCTSSVNDQGVAACKASASILSPGRYQVQSAFLPSSNLYASSQSALETVTVTKATTRVVAHWSVVVQSHGNWHLTMTARLTSAGRPLTHQSLHFMVMSASGHFGCTGITTAMGVASCTVKGSGVFSKLAANRFSGTFHATVDYDASSASGAIRR